MSGYVQRSDSAGLVEALDLILDKGLVVDVFLRVSLIGIEVITVDARVVIASVDTYLRFAEAASRLGLETGQPEGLPQLAEDMPKRIVRSTAKGVIEGARESLGV